MIHVFIVLLLQAQKANGPPPAFVRTAPSAVKYVHN